ncbi:MAG: hypothetical protein E2O77_03395 [Caldithrix sp.]|nr:MAG: hypothetical protein E2O77_03395 [Caldithrix sp.]
MEDQRPKTTRPMSFLRIAGRNLVVITTRFRLKDCRNDGMGKFLVFDFLYRTQVILMNLVEKINRFLNITM